MLLNYATSYLLVIWANNLLHIAVIK